MQAFVLFDDAVQQQGVLLQQFIQQHDLTAEQLPELDKLLASGWEQGWHCAVFIEYEFGLQLQQLPLPAGINGQLHLYWFKQKTFLPSPLDWLQQQLTEEPAGISTPVIEEEFATYQSKIQAIHEAIRRGDVYQINYTTRLHMHTYGHPLKLYHRLRQAVPYAALAHLPNHHWTLCFSPELFLRVLPNGQVETEPMKGTAPILNDGLDEQRAEYLRHDSKNLAENLMIVDLLRNDLGKIAVTGSVQVPHPFTVTAFGKVWQMTSKVQAQLKPQTSVADILLASFPCGSITGAPKRKSMELIQSLENTPRHLYTGSIGFLEQDANSPLGFTACLNVAIRTLALIPTPTSSQEVANNNTAYIAQYGVGGGIVIDSQAQSEYEECGWKASFITQLRPECGLFETMRVHQQKIALLPYHLNRLAHSAHALNIPFQRQIAEELLYKTLSHLLPEQDYRLKLSLSAQGELQLEAHPYQAPAYHAVTISPHRLANHDPLRRHKTTSRAIFDQAWQTAVQLQAFDMLFFNQQGFLLEGGRSSVMIKFEEQWLTPALTLDILNGVTRQQALQQGIATEAYITEKMLYQASKIRLGNALHGWFEVELRL